MKISFFIVLFFGVIFLTGFNSLQEKDHPGKKVFIDAKCQTCHSVESHNLTSKSKKSTDLSNVGAVYRANFLEKFLMKQDKKDGKAHPQAFKGSNEDLFQLAEWLQTLNTGEINETNTGKKEKGTEETGKKIKSDTTGTK
jgi:cytochrome c553